jgi:hypothetical protein
MEKVSVMFLQSGAAHGYGHFAGDSTNMDRDEAKRLAMLGVVSVVAASHENTLQKQQPETAALQQKIKK